MIKPVRTYTLTLALSLSLLICGSSGFIKSFRIALASGGPLIGSLVNAGTLSQASADRIRKDFDDGAICAQDLETDFRTIPKDDPSIKQQKLSASVKAMRCWRVIVNRQHFKLHPRIQNAADIADGILSSLVIFYSEPGEMRADASKAKTAVSASDEKNLERQLKIQVEALEQALEP